MRRQIFYKNGYEKSHWILRWFFYKVKNEPLRDGEMSHYSERNKNDNNIGYEDQKTKKIQERNKRTVRKD